MTTTQLRYFLKTAQTQSMTATAAALSVSQPAVSNAIRELEAEFDVTLFTRRGRELQLTAQGREFLAIASSLITHFDNAADALHHLDEPLPSCSVALTNNYSCLFLPSLYPWLSAHLPEIDFPFHNLSVTEILAGLKDRRLDIGILSADVSDIQPLRHIRVRDFRLEACLSERLDTLPDGPVPLAQLADCPLALYRKGSSHNTLIRRSFARAGIEPNIRFELDQVYAIRELVLRGHAVAFLDPDLFRDVPSVRFHEIANPGFSVPVSLVYRRETELLRPVLRCMRQYFSSTISLCGASADPFPGPRPGSERSGRRQR